MRRLLIVLLVLLTPAFAADRPNFSGFWKLNVEKSDFGPQTPPHSAEYVVRHIGATLSFNYSQDGNTTRVDITPDNEERITGTTEETATWTRAHWSDGVLVLESRERKRFGTQGATGTTWTSTWALSADKQELIITRTLRSGGEEAAQKVVYDRQPLPAPSKQQ